MAEVTAALVKELREKTGAGMMDCKRALGDSGGDIEAAVDWLRKKGLSAAAKKAGRIAAEGLIGVAPGVRPGRSSKSTPRPTSSPATRISKALCGPEPARPRWRRRDRDTAANPIPGSGRTVEEELTHLISTIGENIVLRRVKRLSTTEGAVLSYVHNALGPGIGKIGVLVTLASSAAPERLAELGKQLAMHIAAASPLYLDIASVPQEALDRERSVLREQARATGKPDSVVDRMVEGRLRKFYEEFVLLEQIFVVDQESKISTVVEQASKAAGASIRVVSFARFALGEGVDRQRTEFAAEVAAQLKS